MDIVKLTDEHAIETMQSHVERSLDDPEIRVFQILGNFGIGKRTALRSVFDERGIEPLKHNYTILETAKPIIEKIAAYPAAIHFWGDVFRSNIMHPEVLSAFQGLQNGTITFTGTFLLVANDREFPDEDFPPFPGVHIDFEDTGSMLRHLEQQIGRKGRSDVAIRAQSGNLARKQNEERDH